MFINNRHHHAHHDIKTNQPFAHNDWVAERVARVHVDTAFLHRGLRGRAGCVERVRAVRAGLTPADSQADKRSGARLAQGAGKPLAHELRRGVPAGHGRLKTQTQSRMARTQACLMFP